jgi:hypothetical protein
MDFHLFLVYQVVSSFIYCELGFVLVICYVNVIYSHPVFLLCLIIPMFLSAMKLRAPCYELPPSSVAVYLIGRCVNVSTLRCLISAVHILIYGSHTRNQELPQTCVKSYSPSAFVFFKNMFKGLRSEYSHATFAAYAGSKFYILHAACFRIRKECY